MERGWFWQVVFKLTARRWSVSLPADVPHHPLHVRNSHRLRQLTRLRCQAAQNLRPHPAVPLLLRVATQHQQTSLPVPGQPWQCTVRQRLRDHEKVTGQRLNMQHPLWQDRETRGTLVHRHLMSRQQRNVMIQDPNVRERTAGGRN